MVDLMCFSFVESEGFCYKDAAFLSGFWDIFLLAAERFDLDMFDVYLIFIFSSCFCTILSEDC